MKLMIMVLIVMVMILMNDDCNGDNDIKPLPPLQIGLKSLFPPWTISSHSLILSSFKNLKIPDSDIPNFLL